MLILTFILLIPLNLFFAYHLVRGTKRLWQDGKIASIVGLKLPQFIFWIFFGFGGIFFLTRSAGITYYGVEVETLTVLLTCATAFVSVYIYGLAFNQCRQVVCRITKPIPEKILDRRIAPLLVSVISLDWYSRFKAMLVGQYFTWFTTFSEYARPQGVEFAIKMLASTTGYIALAILVYLSVKKKSYRWRILACMQFLLLAGQGSRTAIALAVLVTLAVSQMVRLQMDGYKSRLKLWIVILLVIMPILFSAVHVARREMRHDYGLLINYPYQIPRKFLFSYLPKALTNIYDRDDEAFLKTQTIPERLSSYMSYAASIQQRILDSEPVMGIEGFCASLSIAIPSAIYPNKPQNSPDVAVYNFYGMGSLGLDAHGTPLADALAYLWLLGPPLVFFIAGAGFGIVCGYLESRFGILGNVLILGMIPLFIPTGDSFGYYLANVRNAFIFVLWVTVFFKFWPSVYRKPRDKQIQQYAA